MSAFIKRLARAAHRDRLTGIELDVQARPPEIDNATLLLDVGDGITAGDASVYSFYHRVCATAEASRITMEEAATEVLLQLRQGTLLATDLPPSVATCSSCGCVDEYGCLRRCYWAAPSLCSNCA